MFMTDQEILTKALEEAVKNGWALENRHWFFGLEFIFSHDFAKSFWPRTGDSLWKSEIDIPEYYGQEWRFRLLEMVLSEDPTKYLERFL